MLRSIRNKRAFPEPVMTSEIRMHYVIPPIPLELFRGVFRLPYPPEICAEGRFCPNFGVTKGGLHGVQVVQDKNDVQLPICASPDLE